MWKFIVQTAKQLSWLFNYLLYSSFATPYYAFELPEEANEALTLYYESPNNGVACEVECSVCLCKIEEGDEVRNVKCGHLFHKSCLDRWTSLNHVTCPLCRKFLAPQVSKESVFGLEVIRFRFFDSRSEEEDRDSFWLR